MRQNLRIWPVTYGVPLTVRLDEGSPTITSNETGWEAINRPLKSGLVRWNGIAPITQDVPIIIDGFRESKTVRWDERKTVEWDVNALRILAGIGWSEYDGLPPTVVRLYGAIHHSDFRWVISGITEGETIRNNNGSLIRYHAVISLTEYRRPDQIKVRRNPHPGPQRKPFYTVKKGDTLNKIAVKLYNHRRWWKLIAKAQKPPIKDPDRELKVGRELRLPNLAGMFLDGQLTSKVSSGKRSRS